LGSSTRIVTSCDRYVETDISPRNYFKLWTNKPSARGEPRVAPRRRLPIGIPIVQQIGGPRRAVGIGRPREFWGE
jgi:hypothetical protein